MKLSYTQWIIIVLNLLFYDQIDAQNAGITTNGTSSFATVIVIPTGTYILNPGEIKILGSIDSIINNGTIYITGNFSNKGNSFSAYASGTEIFNGNTTVLNGSGFKTSVFNNLTINPGATLALNKSIDVTNNWTNINGIFLHGGNSVSFSGAIAPVQFIIGSGTFYDLKLQNSVHFTSSKDTIENSFSNSAGGMVDGTSRVVFKNNSSLISSASKYFYDLEVLAGANVTHNTSNGPIHVAHSFTNNGNLTESPTYIFYFDSSGGVETMSGTGSTTFGNITVGGPALSFSTLLNTGTSNFTIAGDALKFNSNGSSLTSNGIITFSRSVPGITAVQNASGVTGTSALFYNVNIDSAVSASPVTTALDVGSGIAKINNNLQINTGGSVVVNPPFYNNNSTLIYNTTTSFFTNSFEWNSNNTTAGLGVPQNVSVTNTNAVLLSGDRTIAGNLNLTAGSLNINDKTLTINGVSSYSGGTLSGSSNSSLLIGSTGSGTIRFTPASTFNQLKTLTINSGGSLTLGGSAVAGDTLNIVPGNSVVGYGTVKIDGILNTGNLLNLKSNSVGTARVDNSAGRINDSVTVERFIPARRAWRFLSVPVILNSSNKTIHDAWQEGVNNYGLGFSNNKNPKPGYGTHITGNNVSTDGFDFNTTTNPSMKVWDAAANTWNINEPHTISTNISSYRAYCLFVRGSRAVDLSAANYAVSDSTVLRATGILNQTGTPFATQTYSGNAGNIIFVGNPYASSIELYNGGTGILNSSRVSGIDKSKFWVWDPRDPGAYGVGGYVAFSNGIKVPFNGNSNTTYNGGTTIQSGQAFMVQLATGSTNAIFDFQEGDKIISQANIFGRHNAQPIATIYTNLLVPQNNTLALSDGVGAVFNNRFSASVDAVDAAKQWNFDENIALVRGNNTLAIEFRPQPLLTDTLFYRLYLKQQPYTLQIFSQNLFVNSMTVRAWLVDKYLNKKTEVNLGDTLLYNFTPNPDTNSYRNRFMLVFNRQLQTTPVPIAKVANQADPNITGVTNNNSSDEGSISITPNPVTIAKNALLRFNNITKGFYEITVYNSKGQKLGSEKVQHDGSNTVYHLPSNASWSSGLYSVTVLNQITKQLTTLKLIISK